MIRTKAIDQVAQTFKSDLNGNAFFSTNRKAILCRLREASGNNEARLTKLAANQLQQKLLELGILAFPEITHANEGDFRLYRSGTCAADIARLILHPSPSTDREFANLILKAKGKWGWNEPSTNHVPAYTR